MSIFSRRLGYDRTRILDAAARARTKGRFKRAIALYRQVLAVEPSNGELHWKIAPLLAETGQYFDSWKSFRIAARACLRDRQVEQALTVYREAARCLPQQVEAWHYIAKLEVKLGREQEALDVLLEGRRQFRVRWLQPQAIDLLRRAREIAPWDVPTVLDLARLLGRTHQEPEAHMLLDRLSGKCSGVHLRQVRGVQWRLDPTLSNTWQWISAAVAAWREDSDPQQQRLREMRSTVTGGK